MDRQTEGHGRLGVAGLSLAGVSLTCSNPPASLRRRRRACTSDGRAGTRCRRTSERLPLLLRLPGPEPPNSPPIPALLFPARWRRSHPQPCPSNTSSATHVLLRAWAPVLQDCQSCQPHGVPPAPWGPHQPCGDPISSVGIPPVWGHAGGTQQHPSAHPSARRSMEGQTPLTISSSAPSCSPGRRWPR